MTSQRSGITLGLDLTLNYGFFEVTFLEGALLDKIKFNKIRSRS